MAGLDVEPAVLVDGKDAGVGPVDRPAGPLPQLGLAWVHEGVHAGGQQSRGELLAQNFGEETQAALQLGLCVGEAGRGLVGFDLEHVRGKLVGETDAIVFDIRRRPSVNVAECVFDQAAGAQILVDDDVLELQPDDLEEPVARGARGAHTEVSVRTLSWMRRRKAEVISS